MTILLILLAIPGVLAVLLRLGIALLQTGKHTMEWYVARQISDQRAGRGDLSGLAEAEQVRAAAAREQRRYGLHALMWTLLLAFPLMVPGAVIVYPLYSVLWLLPRRGHSNKPANT
ncbi:MAG TPA: hypothetical protein VFO52_01120 [Longimicrobiales bacterium]|nr:hypothetical protein [Longimicrobiales bacterium]